MTRLEARPPAAPDGVRVVVDARPIQEPERWPLTAWYLDHLLRAFAAEPLEAESFVIVSRALRPDPAAELAAAGLPVAASRRIPPTTRALRSAGLTLDSFLLRGAELGAAGGSANGSVFFTAGGAVPLASRLPVVATILDLAPWELPDVYAASPAARFGHRLRARVLRDAAGVIACSRSVAESARRRLHVPPDRLSAVPLAVGDEFTAAARERDRLQAVRAQLALPPRYMAFAGRYDARKDMRTLLGAIAVLRERDGAPPLVVALTGDSNDERERLQRAIEANDIADLVRVIQLADVVERAAVVAGADAFVYPALTDATAVPVIEALSVGVPVICSRAGALPETVGSAGIVVEPRDSKRMAAALEAMWSGGPLAEQLRRHARGQARTEQRRWSDVARETRVAYAEAAKSAAMTDPQATLSEAQTDRSR